MNSRHTDPYKRCEDHIMDLCMTLDLIRSSIGKDDMLAKHIADTSSYVVGALKEDFKALKH